ncbi:drug/metabolite transporter (DMT)-like permease [Pseudomonas sp. SLBN-26]|uniref:DMT family transporter n=1 Tax=Pseudomonadaceae TaxID=135621 RepID=UPI001151D778|nr:MULTISPECIES: DMT family transporter [Pseudomonas]MCP1617885.1 drug/metabolite transporter (DMT)-like permease [Pseudomonas otitidis]TQL07124.1 drug/metabolite transporter (DMT)-like permease [Pseudomonas sp. SLBN-26]
MRPTRLPLDPFACGLMLLLCIIWGFQQVSIKLVEQDVAPVLQLAIRSGIAALVLGAITLWREGRGAFGDGTLLPGLGVGLLFTLEFFFISEGLVRTSASHIAVFLYTAPIFAALGLHLILPEERLSPVQWLGVLVAFGGIALAFLGKPGNAAGSLFGDALGICAAIAWGATTVLIRGSSLSEAAPVKTLFYQLSVAGVVLLAVAAATGRLGLVPSDRALLSLGFQVVVVALISYLGWFWLLRRYLASRLSMLSFMTPLFGVGFGVLVLGEPLDPSFIFGGLLVLGGLLLVTGAELLRDHLARRRVTHST